MLRSAHDGVKSKLSSSDIDRVPSARPKKTNNHTCLLYTSDAADERSSVDLGGRRIIKKKHKKKKKNNRSHQELSPVLIYYI